RDRRAAEVLAAHRRRHASCAGNAWGSPPPVGEGRGSSAPEAPLEWWSARRKDPLAARARFIRARAEFDEVSFRGRGSSAPEAPLEWWSARRKDPLAARARFIRARAEFDEVSFRGRGSSAPEAPLAWWRARTNDPLA